MFNVLLETAILEGKMKATIKDMTRGNPAKLIFLFAIPLILGNLFQQFYMLVDTIVVGQGVGVDALAAIGAADWINWMVLGLVTGLTQGFSILFSQLYGAEDYRGLKKAVGNSIKLTAGAAVLFVVVTELAIDPVLGILQTPADIFDGAAIYLRILFAGVPIILAYNLAAAILRALGDSKSPLYAMIVAAGVNVGLDLLFVMVFHWGIPGAAGATVIAQGCSFLFCLLRIRKIEILQISREDLRLKGDLVSSLLRLGLPIMFQNTVISVGGMVLQSVINKVGVLFVAGFTATNKLYGMMEMAAISYGFAVTTYVGQNLGAGKYERIKKGVSRAVLMALLTAVLISAVMLIFGKPILSMFISASPEKAAEVLRVAYYYLTILSVCLPVLYLLHAYLCALRGMGDTLIPLLSGFVEFGMRVLAAKVLPALLGQTGIFYAEVMAWSGAAVLVAVTYYIRMRKLTGRPGPGTSSSAGPAGK